MNGSKAKDPGQSEFLTYHYNAPTAYIPARKSFADPFILYPNINTTSINLNFIKSKLIEYQHSILERYKGETMTRNLIDSFNTPKSQRKFMFRISQCRNYFN